jgi:hypothetical protein
MGFFNDAFKVVKGAVGGVLGDPLGTIANVATGNLGGIAKDALGGAVGGLSGTPSGEGNLNKAVDQLIAYPAINTIFRNLRQELYKTMAVDKANLLSKQQLVSRYNAGEFNNIINPAAAQSAAVAVSNSTPSVQTYSKTVASAAKKGLTGNSTIDAAIGGALSGLGTNIGGTDVANNAANSVGGSAITQWLKANWWKALLGVSVFGALIYLVVKQNKPKNGYRR